MTNDLSLELSVSEGFRRLIAAMKAFTTLISLAVIVFLSLC